MMELNGHPVGADALKSLALTGYGHFTSMRVDDQHIRGLSLHMERLARDSRTLFGAELDLDQVRAFARRAVEGISGALIVRITVFDPDFDMGHPATAGAPRILVSSRPAGPQPMPPLRAKMTTYVRDVPAVKHVGLLGTLHARRSAQLAGFDDALFSGPDGLISEGGTWNVGFIHYDGTVVWPKAEVLSGVTMTLLQADHEHAIMPITVDAAHRMQAAFATNTTIGVRAISAIDGTQFPTEHPTLAKLRDVYLSRPGETL
ncbi:aminotransferase class IV family protein [Streptomyces syringium]|uniref:aminotransferase class IV family protein n=1 Tax=Streptomyces syringium TaxID=76729 RepID=UPI00341619DC